MSCSVDECDKPVKVKMRGLCSMHNERWRLYGDVNGAAVRPTADERFWAKVERSGTCLLWTGALTPKGYGQFRVEGKTLQAHKWAWTQANGPISPGLVLDHQCHDPQVCQMDTRCPHRRCVNTADMALTTNTINSSAARRSSMNRMKIRCKHGHRFTEENTYIDPQTKRRACRTCRRERHRLLNINRRMYAA